MAENIFNLIFTKTVFFSTDSENTTIFDHLKNVYNELFGSPDWVQIILNKIKRISMTLAKKKKDDLAAGGSHRGEGQMTTTAGNQAGEGWRHRGDRWSKPLTRTGHKKQK